VKKGWKQRRNVETMAGRSAFIRAIGSGIGSVVWLPKQGIKLRKNSTSRKQEEARVMRKQSRLTWKWKEDEK